MRADRGDRPDPGKRKGGPGKAASSEAFASVNEGQSNRTRRRCLYRARPGCALLVKRTILRCGEQVRR